MQFTIAQSALSQALLKLKPEDEREALLMFNAIQRFMGDPFIDGTVHACQPPTHICTDNREHVVGNYLIQQAISNVELRDELYCQLCNQTWLNPNEVNSERGWLLLAMVLGCVPPSDKLYPYLLCYITAHGVHTAPST